MNPERMPHAIAYLSGEVHALYLLIVAISLAHPDRPALLHQIDQAKLGGSILGAQPTPDAMLEGFQFVIDNLLETLRSAQEDPNNLK